MSQRTTFEPWIVACVSEFLCNPLQWDGREQEGVKERLKDEDGPIAADSYEDALSEAMAALRDEQRLSEHPRLVIIQMEVTEEKVTRTPSRPDLTQYGHFCECGAFVSYGTGWCNCGEDISDESAWPLSGQIATVHSNHGNFFIDAVTGIVQRFSTDIEQGWTVHHRDLTLEQQARLEKMDAEDQQVVRDYQEITRFDLDEYAAYYGSLPGHHGYDILDLGFWRNGNYEPADHDWRGLINSGTF